MESALPAYRIQSIPCTQADHINVNWHDDGVTLTCRPFRPEFFGTAKAPAGGIEVQIPDIPPHARIFITKDTAWALMEQLQTIL